MALNSKIKSVFGRPATDDEADSVAVNTIVDEKQNGNEKGREDPAIGTTGSDDLQGELPSEDAQRGVHDVEAVTLTWTKTTLVAVFLKYVVILTVDYFLQSPPNSLSTASGYFTSSMHSSPRFSTTYFPMSRANSNRIRCSMSFTLSRAPCRLRRIFHCQRFWMFGVVLKASLSWPLSLLWV